MGIEVPTDVAPFAHLASTPARAQTFAASLRAVTAGVKDVQAWATTLAAPEWAGDTRDAHDHTATRFAVRLDSAEAALERAVLAADRFENRLFRLQRARGRIDADRTQLNADLAELRLAIEAATDDSGREELRRRAERLSATWSTVVAEIDRWSTRQADAEADFIAALRGVDSVTEGARAAAAPERPEVGALIPGLLAVGADPAALALWWARLTRAQRQVVITEHPELVGNADGVPVRDRDEANRTAIYSDVDRLAQREQDGQLTAAERAALENARHVRGAIEDHREVLDLDSGREVVHVVVYKPGEHGGDGAVAISFGDPDRADHVSATIPGLTTEVASLDSNLAKTYDLHQAAGDLRNGSVATLFWFDYDAPSGHPLKPWEVLDVAGVALDVKAEQGGDRFADFIDGLRASDEGERAHLTAIGHSYGSTALGHALQDGLVVDDAIVLGSPGQPEATAAALTDADVWIGSKDYDPVSLLGHGDRGGGGALGHDPATDEFGGTRFTTGDGSLRFENLLKNHTSYFTGSSLDNMAHIVTDSDADVTREPHRGQDGGGHLTLSELLISSSAASGGSWLWERGEDVVGLGEWALDRAGLRGLG